MFKCVFERVFESDEGIKMIMFGVEFNLKKGKKIKNDIAIVIAIVSMCSWCLDFNAAECVRVTHILE